ncbi:MAG TPA: hypothetical protein P5280_01265 [Cyclobacteriaceae bacterium]|nr:hypothetical protein [Cyclobacteriaceae bacterium]
MTSWKEFAQQAPEIAAFGKARFESGVAYLGHFVRMVVRVCIL